MGREGRRGWLEAGKTTILSRVNIEYFIVIVRRVSAISHEVLFCMDGPSLKLMTNRF